MTTPEDQLRAALSASYAIEREIGRGGMATVYLARDLKHDRHVAVKVLNPELGAVLGVERFLSEIKVTANLQHPNLLPLFDSGSAAGQLFYVMPYVEGESLRAKLERERQLPVDEAVRITIAAANALDYAHAHSVIHRDLKPENILIQHGQPVIADFGIALAISNAGGARVTQTGLSLGTPQYMSPEQATGDRVIDGRSDIYSLGAILYEMLTGEPPHTGNTVQATIAKVLTDPVKPLRSYRDTVPVQVELATAKALAKLPADRFATAAAFVRALEGDATGLGRVAGVAESGGAPLRAWIRHPATAVLAVIAVAASTFGALKSGGTNAETTERTVRFGLVLPKGSLLNSGLGHFVTVSPDGRQIAFVTASAAGGQLWLRDVALGTSRPLTGADGVGAPAFTPDGRWIVYRANFGLTKVSTDGGQLLPLFRVSGGTQYLAFFGDDSLLFSNDGSSNPHLWRGSLAGGTPERFLRDDSTQVSTWQYGPVLAPDRETVFFVSGTDTPGLNTDVVGFATLSSRSVALTRIQASSVLGYVENRLVYVNDAGAIMAVGFDLRRRVVVGQPVATGETVLRDAYGPKAVLTTRGDLAFIDDGGDSRPTLIGGGRTATPLMGGERSFADLRYSPDGRRVALTARDGARTDIWIYSIESGSLDRVPGPGRTNDRVEWSPDGKRVVFRSDADGPTAMWWQPIDGSGPAERLTPKDAANPALEGMIAPDGKMLVYRVDTPNQLRDIWAIAVGADAKPVTILTTPFDELNPRVSPDGKWMVYVSNESGRDEVYVRPFPGPGGRTIVSVEGGGEPLWSRDQGRIFYRSGLAVVAASVSLGPSPSVSARDTVAIGNFLSMRFHPAYDVAPDGRFLMLQSSEQQVTPTIILNWGAAMTARLGPVKP